MTTEALSHSNAVCPQQAASSHKLAAAMALLGSPFVIIFLSSNIVNVGNLAFNLLFSRWMGPEVFGDLAVTLTLMLAVMGVLTAAQMAVSQMVASVDEAGRSALLTSLANINRLVMGGASLALPAVLLAIWLGNPGAALGMSDPMALLVLALAVPFVGPLSLVRGVINGNIDVKRIVLSAQGEMIVRLALAIIAWQAGFGLIGVVWSLAISLVVGWAIMGRVLPAPAQLLPRFGVEERKLAKRVGLIALPFAMLQAAQVVLLDGDVFLAKLLLTEREAGLVAALSLVQRIQFFACFALASILLPSVSRAVANGGNGLREALPVGALFLAVAVPFIAGAILVPDLMIRVFFGAAYLDAQPALLPTALAACAFTGVYLVATFMAGHNVRTGIWLICAAAPVQIGAILLAAQILPGFDLASLLWVKLTCMGVLVMVVGGYTLGKVAKRG